MCSVLFDVKRLWAAFQLAVCYSDCDSRVHRWVCLVFHPPKRTDVTHSQCAKLHWEMASCDYNEMASGFNPLHLHQKSPPKTFIFSVWCRVRAQHLECARVHLEIALKNDPYNFTFCPSRLFFLSPPPQAHFFLSGGTNRAFPAILPFSHFINSGHNAFDVIFGSAPGLRAHWPARHSRHSIIFLSSPAVHTHTRAHTHSHTVNAGPGARLRQIHNERILQNSIQSLLFFCRVVQ